MGFQDDLFPASVYEEVTELLCAGYGRLLV